MANIIDIIVRAKDATASAWKSVQGHAAALKNKIGAAMGGVAKFAKMAAVAIGLVGAAAVAAAKKAVAAYQVQAAAEAKLAAVLKATGYAAGFTAEQLKDEAAELQKLTGIGDETIISMQGLLASFRNVKGDAFKRATVAALDMGSAMRKAGGSAADVQSASLQLGKALNDPIGQLGALSRVGVTFTEQQKEQIKSMAAAGDIAGAQAIILNELEKEFGGTAEAMGKASHGLDQMKAAFGDAIEKIGQAIVESDGFDSVIARITAALENLSDSGLIELWAENVRSAISGIMPILDKLGKAFGWVKEKIQQGAAFAGALAGGSSFSEAAQIAKDTPGQLEADKQARLAAIREEKAERKAAREAEQQAEMAAAKGANEKGAVEEKRLAEERAKIEADIAAKKEAKAEALAAIEEEGFRKAAQAGQDKIDAIQKEIEGFALTREDRRKQEQAVKDQKKAADREKELLDRKGRGVKLSKDNEAFLRMRELLREQEAAKAQKKIDDANAERRAEENENKRQRDMLAKLDETRILLEKNLQVVA